MNFDLGEILTRAFHITWKHKVLWLFSALPVLVGFLIIPIFIIPIFFSGVDSRGNPVIFENPIFIVLFIVFNIFISILSFLLYALSASSVTLGILRVEEGSEILNFQGLFRDGMKYFVRILGVGLLIGVGISLVFTAIFFVMALFGIVTMGIGFICVQPLIILMYPLMMVLYAFIEQSQAAVVADDMGVTQAIAKGWELLKADFWRLMLISLIIYLGVGIVTSVILTPFMLPFFFLPLLFETSFFESGPQSFGLAMIIFMLIFLPVLALVQGVTITFMKSAYVLVYLRLTRTQDNAPILPESNA